MASQKAIFTIFLVSLVCLWSTVQSAIETADKQNQQQQPISASTLNTPNTANTPDLHTSQPQAAELSAPTQLLANSTRYARLMKIVHDPKALIAKRYHAAMQRVITRADHLPPAGNPQRRSSSVVYPPSSPYHKGRPPMMRRIQHGPPANAAGLSRYAYEAPKGISNYALSKGPVPFNAGKLNFNRAPFPHTQQQQHQIKHSHPNALTPHTSAPLGSQYPQQQLQFQASQQHPQYQPSTQQQLHPQQNQQPQQQQYHQEHNFKASPPFNGKAIVRPLIEPHDPNYRQHMQQLQEYVGASQPQLTIKQYPIPQQPLQKHQSSHYPQPSVLQAQPLQALSHNQGQNFHYENMRPHEEPVLHPHVKHILPPPGGAGYAVYENNELDGEEEVAQPYARPYSAYYPPTPSAAESAQVYQQSVLEANAESAAATQEAEEYIKFMNSNDYFLPKHEPNYRQRDTQQDRQHKQQEAREQQQQQQELQQQREQQQQSEIQQTYAQFPRVQQTHYGKPPSSANTIIDGASANHLNAPIKISQLFYQEDPVPAIVHTSYQTGNNNNNFVVNSNGNKVVKHIPQSQTSRSSTSLSTTSAPTYSKVRHNTPRNRTPEPQRFEFTERDAMPSAYTHSPSLNSFNDQLRHRATGVVGTSSTPNLPASSSNKFNTATLASADDPEDEEDVHSASSSFYGRMPVRQSTEADATTVPTPPAPVEQKDTEDYCERMCANVQDSDEEIVCGSDGYMYTSEAQMECYASCLHIDVTVTSKGTCNVR